MFRLGADTSKNDDVSRPLSTRIAAVSYAAMAYWFYRWDWGESIALDGLWLAGEAVGNRAFTDFAVTEAQNWMAARRG